ncbi:hypothetical protein EIP86_006875 [Pleurotus ostreatoroseus]|nr:hypothetical protein EIP86_006875 [Pleurotus ostreatoroseus]
MTRTERATSPRAILKDRSESKSGMDKHTPKGGAGTHNWGSLINERDLEDAAFYDQDEEAEGARHRPYFSRGLDFSRAASTPAQPTRPTAEMRRTSSASVTEEDREKALQFRKNAFKSPDVDLAAIARTSSAVSTSPPSTTVVVSDADTTK